MGYVKDCLKKLQTLIKLFYIICCLFSSCIHLGFVYFSTRLKSCSFVDDVIKVQEGRQVFEPTCLLRENSCNSHCHHCIPTIYSLLDFMNI